jgi:hypothetical protein
MFADAIVSFIEWTNRRRACAAESTLVHPGRSDPVLRMRLMMVLD